MTRTVTLLILTLLLGAGSLMGPASAQDDAHPLLDLLAYLPADEVASGNLVTYGNIAAWHAATGIPRVANVTELS